MRKRHGTWRPAPRSGGSRPQGSRVVRRTARRIIFDGALAATSSFLLPSVLAMLSLAAVSAVTTRPPALRGASGGLMAAAAGLLVATAVRLGSRATDRPLAGRTGEGGARGDVGPRRPG